MSRTRAALRGPHVNLSKLSPVAPRKVVRARRRWARLTVEDRLGLFIRRWPMPGTAPAELGRLLGSLDVSCVVDVGAHTGGFGRIVRRLGFTGDIVSFEPATATFRELERRTRRRSTLARPPLGARLGRRRAWSWTSTRRHSSTRCVVPDRATRADRRPTASRSRSSMSSASTMSGPSSIPTDGRVLLKIDAQGFDLEVLKGAEASLDSCVALQVEVSGVALYDGSPPLHEVVTLSVRPFVSHHRPLPDRAGTRSIGSRSSTSTPPSSGCPSRVLRSRER